MMNEGTAWRATIGVGMALVASTLAACARPAEVSQARDDAPAREMRALADRCQAVHHEMRQSGSMRAPSVAMQKTMAECDQQMGVTKIAPPVRFW